MSRFDQILYRYTAAAILIAASFATMAASAQSARPVSAAAAPKQAANAPANKPVVSPYARAASQRERLGQAPMGHAPTAVQGMGKHKSHTGARPK